MLVKLCNQFDWIWQFLRTFPEAVLSTNIVGSCQSLTMSRSTSNIISRKRLILGSPIDLQQIDRYALKLSSSIDSQLHGAVVDRRTFQCCCIILKADYTEYYGLASHRLSCH